MFLTGTKKEIANLAVDSLKLTAVEKKPEERDRRTTCSSTAPSSWSWTNRRGCAAFSKPPATASTGERKAKDPRGGPATGTRTMSFSDLPAVNATLNGLSAVFLAWGFTSSAGKNRPRIATA